MNIDPRTSIVLIIVASMATAACAESSIWGSNMNSAKLLYVETVTIASSPEHYVKHEIKFPKNGKPNGNGLTITGIQAHDQMTNRTGGHATIFAGGTGSNSVSIQLKSQYNYGLMFVVEIYGVYGK